MFLLPRVKTKSRIGGGMQNFGVTADIQLRRDNVA
jgi:hypothetical protein